jgi:hypothetical protein
MPRRARSTRLWRRGASWTCRTDRPGACCLPAQPRWMPRAMQAAMLFGAGSLGAHSYIS